MSCETNIKYESKAKCSYKSKKTRTVVNKIEDQRGGLNHVHEAFHGEEIKDVMEIEGEGKGVRGWRAVYRVSREGVAKGKDSERVKTGGFRWRLGAKRVEEGRGERDSERLYLGGNHFGVAA